MKKAGIRKLLPRRTTVYLILMLLFAGISSFIASVVPGLYSSIVDKGIMASDLDFIFKMLAVILGLTLLNSALKIYNSITINKIGLYVSRALKENTIKKVFDSSYEFFDKVRTGELIERINEVSTVSVMFNPQFLTILVSIITGLFSLVQVIKIDARMVLIYIVAFLVLFFVSIRFSFKYKKLTYDIVDLNAQFSKNVNESIEGMNEIKANNFAHLKRNTLSQIDQSIFDKTKEQNSCFAFNSELIGLINVVSSLSITALYAVLFRKDGLTLGTYVALMQYTSLVLAPAQMASSSISILQPIFVTLKRLDFFDKATEQDDSGTDIDKIHSIAFEDVSFAYDTKPVLDHVNFKLMANEKLLLDGENGSGKTTLVKLLVRLYDSYSGTIRFNGTDSRQLSLTSIRSQIALVFQETFLFDDTLYNNLVCGNPDIKKKRSSGR